MVFDFTWARTWDLEHGVFRAWWFDPLSVTVAFAVFVSYFWRQERIRGLSSDNNFHEIKEGFSEIVFGRFYGSLSAYWIGIFLWKCIVPPAAAIIPDGFPHDVKSLLYLSTEVVYGVVAYDFVFFFIHWAMHEIRWLKAWHGKHHMRDQGRLEARDTLRHSVVDGSLQVFINIMVQRHTLWGAVKSRLARLLHNVIVIWMLTESHTASPYPNVFRRWCVGVREHHLHHSGGMAHSSKQKHASSYGHYHRHQQFFGYLDDARAWWYQQQRQYAKQASKAPNRNDKIVDKMF